MFARRSFLALLLLSLTVTRALSADDIHIQPDIPYKPNAPTDYERDRCKLDLYLPPDSAPSPHPVLLWFHGGGLTAGDKSSAAPLAKLLASKGVVVASANYRLSPKATYPAYNQDAAAAVAYLHAHLPDFAGDPKRLFIAGHSAGGYLACIVAYDPALLAPHKLTPSDIAGVIAVAPQVFTHFTIRAERGVKDPQTTPVIDPAAPAYHVSRSAPPTLILLGDHDWPVRLEECQYFTAMLHHLGHPDASLHVIPHRTHSTVASALADNSDPGLKILLNFLSSRPRPTTAPAP